ncbi:hypothetical protein M407DRAFT_32415 [Tulasnella calospora MUT 4182]|uniref:Uncharacterized protein n=1 Tax=Tulasnella calospora MUT 4182 TaxID=1051891 RepID=A0A0C3Q402_9AGAM|nr:hypothetical protein M407DRAFT_32415 [Tulasnella calospora MUT 4182]
MLSSGPSLKYYPSDYEDDSEEDVENAITQGSPNHRVTKSVRLSTTSSSIAESCAQNLAAESSLSELSSDEGLLKNAQQQANTRQPETKSKQAEKRGAPVPIPGNLATNLPSTSLPHSTQGYIGSEGTTTPSEVIGPAGPPQGPLPKNVPYNAQPRLLELCRRNYEVVSHRQGPTLLLDGSGRIIAWRVGSFRGERGQKRWEAHAEHLTGAVEHLSESVGG